MSTTGSQPLLDSFQCDNCVVNNAPGNHKTKNCITFPCKRCQAAGKPREHCSDLGGYLKEPTPPRKARFIARQPRPNTFPPKPSTHSSLTPDHLRHPSIMIVALPGGAVSIRQQKSVDEKVGAGGFCCYALRSVRQPATTTRRRGGPAPPLPRSSYYCSA